MPRYIGIDVHAQSSTVAVMSENGKRLKESRIETNAQALREMIRSVPRPRFVCIEEGLLAEWAFEILDPISDEVVIAIPERAVGSKNDSLDAWARADELRRGQLKRVVFKDPRRFTTLREAVRAHQLTVCDLIRAKNRLKSVFVARSMASTKQELYSVETRNGWIAKLPPDRRQRAGLLGLQLDAVTQTHAKAEAWLLEEAKKNSVVKLIATAPGIGPIRAAQVVATVVTPHRFRTKRQFWSYCGLGIVTRSSSDWVRERGQWQRRIVAQTRGLGRNRNPLLKSVFKGAATTIVMLDRDPLAAKYRALLEHTKPNLAKLSVARHVAAIVLRMWKNKEEYDSSRIPIQTA
jgi:transposase